MKKLGTIMALMTCTVLGTAAAPPTPHWSVTWKKMHMTGPVLEQVGVLPKRSVQELGASNWSIGCETLDREYAEVDNYKEYLGELGVSSARIQSGWARCEQVKGKYDFKWLDNVVDGIREQGVQPWMCLGYGNPVYGAGKGLGAKIFTDEPTMKAWLSYVEATVKRYKDRVYEWEVWNEPNLGANKDNYDAYASLLSNTVDVIKRIQPDATIIGFGLSRMPLLYTQKALDVLKERGQLGMLDYVSFHPYYENPDDATPGIEALAELVKSYSPDIKLFQGECGCPSILEWGHALRYNEWSEYSQAKWIMRRMAIDWSLGLRSSIFTFVDLQYPNMQQSFGLLRTNLLKKVVYKRPSYYGVQHMVNLFHRDIRSAGRMDYQANTSRRMSVVGLKDSLENTIGAVMWYDDRLPSSDLAWDNVEIWIDGLSLEKPVLVEVITGRVYALPQYKGNVTDERMKFTGLPVWDSPMVVIESAALPAGTILRDQTAGGSTKDMLF